MLTDLNMAFEPYTCTLDSDTQTSVKLYLFKNVENVEEIRDNILKGIWKCAAIKPSLIVDPFQVCVAANRAALAHRAGTMVTRTVYSEILYNLSLTKNISQSLSKFGVEKGRELLLCFLVGAEHEDPEDPKDPGAAVLPRIRGERCPVGDVGLFADSQQLSRVYKLAKCAVGDLDLIVSRMVTKSFVSH